MVRSKADQRYLAASNVRIGSKAARSGRSANGQKQVFGAKRDYPFPRTWAFRNPLPATPAPFRSGRVGPDPRDDVSQPPEAASAGVTVPLDPPSAPSESGAMATDAARPGKTNNKGGLGETTRFLLLLLLFAILLRSFVVAPFSIPSGSMMPRLMIGDYLFVAKWPYGYSRYSIPFGLASFGGRI
jgi:hypothetical protein